GERQVLRPRQGQRRGDREIARSLHREMTAFRTAYADMSSRGAQVAFAPAPREDRSASAARRWRPPLLLGASVAWLSVIVLLPLAAVLARSGDKGWAGFWNAISAKEAVAAIKFTVLMSIAVAAVNAVSG